MTYVGGNAHIDYMTRGPLDQFASEMGAFCSGTFVSATWPANNLAIYMPLLIHSNTMARQIWWMNGGTASGTIDAAIYDNSGATRLAVGGGVTQSGTNVPQAFNITDILLVPGRYWIGLVCSTTAATIRRWTGATNVTGAQKFIGLQQESLGSASMPSSATFAAASNNFIPCLGISLEANTL